MKNITILITLLVFTSLNAMFGQCKTFAKDICKAELKPYIHDGNYNAAILFEGESAELYKTFNAGMDYRIVVCSSEIFPKVQFIVKDLNNNVLFDNKTKNYVNKWDFKLEGTQQLEIDIIVPGPQNQNEELSSGCVAILFGILDKK
jgi:hypothetical protein